MRKVSTLLSAAAMIAGLAVVGGPPAAHAVPSGFTDSPVVATPFTKPTEVEVLPGGRLLVLEKSGTMKLVHPDGSITSAGSLAAQVCDGGERGLLSVAVDPGFAANGHLYLYRTRGSGSTCANALSRYTMTGDTIDLGSELLLVDNIAWTATNHNGGTVQVGRDGFLYLSVGEGAQQSRSQNLASLGGKILRITTTGNPAPGNPFLGATGHGRCAKAGQSAAVCEEIFALGLRNPFRMAFDPNSATTRFRINDVGAGTWEEVDDGIAGANYGWPTREGPCLQGQTTGCSPDPSYTEPITWYPIGSTGRYIVGGAFVPNGWWPGYDGAYLFADGASNQMWTLPASGAVNYSAPFASSNLSVTTDMTFGTRNGERAMFYVNHGNGQLRKIVGPNASTSDPDGPAYLGGSAGQPPVRPPTQPPVQPIGGAHAFTAYPRAERVFDSRNGIGGPLGAVAGGQTRTVSLHVPAGASAALVNITLDNAAGPEEPCPAPSYLVAWQPGTAMPSTSNANVGACDVAANTAVLQVDAAGATNLQVYADVDVILDVLGYYSPSAGPVAAGRFQALTPTRLIDTRAPSAAAGNDYSRANDGNTSLVRLPVAGRGGVPAQAKTVSLTVTAIGPGSDASGYITAYAGGGARPETSTVNHSGGFDTRANLALVPVGADGTVELYLYQVADVVVDVGGWITSASDAPAIGGRLHLVAPTRIADSRNGIGVAPLAPGGQVTLEPFGVPSSAIGIAQNVTMVSRAPGWICATPSPWSGGDVSIQNARAANQDRPAFTFTTLGPGPAARLRYCSQDRADIIVDVMGWFE